MHRAAFDLVPRTRSRYGRARPCAHRVRCRERRAVTVATCIDENPPTTIDLVKLLCQMIRIAFNQDSSDLMRKARNRVKVRLAIERHRDVKAFRSRRLDPRRQPEFVEKLA